MQRIDDIIDERVRAEIGTNANELKRLRDENESLTQRLKELESINADMKRTRDDLFNKVSGLNEDLNNFRLNKDASYSINRIDQLRRENESKEKKIVDLLKEINLTNNQMDDIITENRALRRMAGVGDDYGIDLTIIKLRDKEQMLELKRLNDLLEKDN